MALLDEMAKVLHANVNVQLNVNNNRYHLRISACLRLLVCGYLTLQAVDTRPRA